MYLIEKIDNYILFIIKNHIQNKYLDRIMSTATKAGDLGLIWIVIAFFLLLSEHYRIIGGMVIFTLIISTIMGEGILKHIVRRARPCNGGYNGLLLISKPVSYSFPSGHTLSSFASASVLSMYFRQYSFIFFIIAFIIALSRIYLYVHYPTDVIGGIVFGLLCSKLIFIIL
ncbi:phosphatase PAP2 family protein [Clostridium sp. WILCCON 0269]|uniref:Phosphatase PAP2 family protein n=1 Tax=Candidatus Clostridium eludens TaxID=3381663 RepID=A0ABW8SIB3_9CLOT